MMTCKRTYFKEIILNHKRIIFFTNTKPLIGRITFPYYYSTKVYRN